MNVSKHYIEDRVATTSEGTDSVKFAKYLVPQGSLGWKNTSKVNIKGKRRPTDSKPKMLNSGKDPRIPSSSKHGQDGSSISIVSASSGSTEQDTLLNVKASVGHKEKYLEKSTHLGVHSFSNTLKAAEDPVFFSPQELDSGVQSFKKPSSSDKEVGGIEGKAAVAGRKLASDVEKGSSIPGKQIQDATEPRRSNRRIQPTSRLELVNSVPDGAYDLNQHVCLNEELLWSEPIGRAPEFLYHFKDSIAFTWQGCQNPTQKHIIFKRQYLCLRGRYWGWFLEKLIGLAGSFRKRKKDKTPLLSVVYMIVG
ncbi:Agenet-like domain-containing protein [Cinnamomum micranthum f. kanehirae]|uniref:Agenet-like domain-containing protein n=1 Tax=Cinnamomum micranthum f. kanehirae TaxID=337451 RepID=A0A443PGA8_9MAGN|nr:Agenet-like domain-containing protein [Cinnamomum micranthum f. kanehirae]